MLIMAGTIESEKISLLTKENFENSRHLSSGERYVGLNQSLSNQQQISENKINENTKTFSQISKRGKIILILCVIAQMLASCALSFLGPLYPTKAEKKGMPVTVIGWVFGLFNLLIFIFSPIYGTFMAKIGPKFCYVAGFIVGGVCYILFGTLDKSPPGIPFIATSFACRFVEGLGYSAFITASLTVITSEFPQNVGFVYGLSELGGGVGYMVGPVIGGALHDLGGYGLPFYVIGVIIFVHGCLMCAFLPGIKPITIKKREKSVFHLLRSPLVIVSVVSIMCGTLGSEMFTATFSKHLETFNLSASLVSVMFSAKSTVYSIMATVWGYITDKKDIQAPLIIGAHLLLAIGFLILGPSPLLSFIPFQLWTVGIGIALFGFSLGGILIANMKCMLKGAYKSGFESNMETNAMVAGLFNSVYNMGGAVGPVGGDALIAAKGYPLTYTIVGFLHIFAMLLQIIYKTILYMRKHKTVEEDDMKIQETIIEKID